MSFRALSFRALSFRAIRSVLAAVLLLGLAQVPADDARALQPFETDTLTIVTEEGARHDFAIEIAATPDQRALGLMYRQELPPDYGMLFVYPRPQEASMWMKNTYVSLDMLFIDSRGRIVKIAERTEPLSLRAIGSGRPVKAVLEVEGGTVEELGISAGDRVEHETFTNGS